MIIPIVEKLKSIYIQSHLKDTTNIQMLAKRKQKYKPKKFNRRKKEVPSGEMERREDSRAIPGSPTKSLLWVLFFWRFRHSYLYALSISWWVEWGNVFSTEEARVYLCRGENWNRNSLDVTWLLSTLITHEYRQTCLDVTHCFVNNNI